MERQSLVTWKFTISFPFKAFSGFPPTLGIESFLLNKIKQVHLQGDVRSSFGENYLSTEVSAKNMNMWQKTATAHVPSQLCVGCPGGAQVFRTTLCVLSGHFTVLICFLWPHQRFREQTSPSFKLDLHSLIAWGHRPVCNITATSMVNWTCQSLGCGLVMCYIIKFLWLKLPANGITSLSLLERVHSFIKLHNSQPIV